MMTPKFLTNVHQFLTILIVLLACLPLHAQSEFDYSSYENISLSDYLKTYDTLSQELPKPFGNTGDIVLLNPPRKLTDVVIFTGALSELDGPAISFLNEWVRIEPAASNFASLYGNIIEVDYEGSKHRLLIQSKLVPYFQNEIIAGNSVRLYFIHFGWYVGHSPMFLVTEFASTLP
jgi:hypothetical protein